MKGIRPTFVFIGVEDYAASPLPWWTRATAPWEAQYLVRRKVAPVLAAQAEPFDALIAQSWECAVALRNLARRTPAALLLDATPGDVNAQLRRQGFTGWRRSLAHAVHNRAFASATAAFSQFLPMGSDCAGTLQREYGIPAERCSVTFAPQDLEEWKPRPRSYEPPLRLLFVGNDFLRKGGDFLLKLYSGHLAETCTLTIASNDPLLASLSLPPGVELLRGRNREQLLEVYRTHDVFMLPTRQDYMPQALAEAMATGLPCLATDVGGIGDMVRNGETGFLFPLEAPASEWAARIRELAQAPARLRDMSAAARGFAERHLGMDRFSALLRSTVFRLADGRNDRGIPA